MPEKPCSSMAGSGPRKSEKMGAPSMTADSNRKRFPRLNGESGKVVECMHHGTLIGSYGVHAAFESRAQVLGSRLPGLMIDRRILQKDVRGAGANEIHG